MALAFNNNHITCYDMNAQWTTGFAQTYFANTDYMVVQGWIHATFLSPNIINQTEAP